MEVPSDTIASIGLRGKANIVAGLSPVKGAIWQSFSNPYRLMKYLEIGPRLPPPSSRTSPSFLFKSSTSLLPAASLSNGSLQVPLLMSHKFIPQTSLISIGAIFPTNREARKDDTRDILAVAE